MIFIFILFIYMFVLSLQSRGVNCGGDSPSQIPATDAPQDDSDRPPTPSEDLPAIPRTPSNPNLGDWRIGFTSALNVFAESIKNMNNTMGNYSRKLDKMGQRMSTMQDRLGDIEKKTDLVQPSRLRHLQRQ